MILVDHGSPVPAVTEVRNYLAGQLGVLLRDTVKGVRPASMERRPGKPYGFNEPLLEKQLREPGYNCGDVVVAMAFLQPGRHAGADGDVASICRHAEEQQSGLTAHMTPLIGDHPLLLDILKDKWEEGWSREPVS